MADTTSRRRRVDSALNQINSGPKKPSYSLTAPPTLKSSNLSVSSSNKPKAKGHKHHMTYEERIQRIMERTKAIAMETVASHEEQEEVEDEVATTSSTEEAEDIAEEIFENKALLRRMSTYLGLNRQMSMADMKIVASRVMTEIDDDSDSDSDEEVEELTELTRGVEFVEGVEDEVEAETKEAMNGESEGDGEMDKVDETIDEEWKKKVKDDYLMWLHGNILLKMKKEAERKKKSKKKPRWMLLFEKSKRPDEETNNK